MNHILLPILGHLVCQCPAAVERQEAVPGILAKGQRIELRIKKVPEFDRKRWDRQYEIGDDGCVQLPMIGKIKISGLSLDEAAGKIEATLHGREIFPLAEIELVPTKHGGKRDPAKPRKGAPRPAPGNPPQAPPLPK